MTTATLLTPSAAVPQARFDLRPLAVLASLAALALPAVGHPGTWVTLTIAGLAMGMIIFLVASGLTLVFGLMEVLNFGHGVFIALGAYVSMTTMLALGAWVSSDSLLQNAGAVLAAMVAAATMVAVSGLVFERLLVRPVYGMPLRQILVTMGGLIIGEEIIKVFWGPDQLTVPLPQALRGSLSFGDASVEKYRLLAVVVGSVVFVAMLWILTRTKVGLLVRAGVQDREMVEALGYRSFIGVFVTGSALAGLGGALWALYQQSVVPQIGTQVNVLIFAVIIIGGLGSTFGCFVGALMVGLVANYAGFLMPKLALVSTIALMVAILLWRPRGLYPVGQQ